MTNVERVLAGRLLARAGEEFSNHGCNDMGKEMLEGISATDRKALETQYNEWNSRGRDPMPFEIIGDSAWMAFLSSRLLDLN